jgi:hypothetical protein
MRSPAGWLPTLILAAALAAPALAQTAGATPEQEALIARLGALFEVDYIQAFAQSEVAFRKATQADDLGLMVALVKLLGPETMKHESQILMDRLCPVASERAAATGHWREQGDVLLCQATCRLNWTTSLMDLPLYPWDRRTYIARRALAAYAKTGVDPPAPREWFAGWPPSTTAFPSEKLKKEVYDWPRVLKEVMDASSDASNMRGQIEALPQPYRDRVKAVAAANAEGREGDAVAMAIGIAQDALNDPSLSDATRCEPIRILAGQAAQPGGEALAPLVRNTLASIESSPDFPSLCGNMTRFCMYLGWSAVYPTDQGIHEACWLIRRGLAAGGLAAMGANFPLLRRLRDLGLYGELATLVAELDAAMRAGTQAQQDDWGRGAFSIAGPRVPVALREFLLATTSRHAASTGDAKAVAGAWYRGGPAASDPMSFRRRCEIDPAFRPYHTRIAQWLLEVAAQVTKEDQRAWLVEEASDLYTLLDQPQRAEAARALLAELIAGKPDAVLRCALGTAASAAAGGQWEDVPAALELAAKAAPQSTSEALDAAVLLTEAQLRLGKPADAEPWMTKAKSLISSVSLSPAEKASYLMTLADLCDPRGPTD